MSAGRKPVGGEVWTWPNGVAWECVVDVPDAGGRYVWQHRSAYVLNSHFGLNPPLPQPPAELGEWWVNVYVTDGLVAFCSLHPNPEAADRKSGSDRIGRCKLDLSTWVPCDGEEVLA